MKSAKKHIFRDISCALSMLLFSSLVLSADNGKTSKSNFSVCGCDVSKMTLKYSLDNMRGEPKVAGKYKWEASGGTADDCLSYNTRVALQVSDGNNTLGYISLAASTVREAGKGYSYHTTGSPPWDSLICEKDGSSCIDGDDAESAWDDIEVTGFEVMCSGGSSGWSSSNRGPCEQEVLTRQESGYERVRCDDCRTVKIRVTEEYSGIKNYNDNRSLNSAIDQACH
jgi:hypothetical protein